MTLRIKTIGPECLDRLEELENVCFGNQAWSRNSLEFSLNDPVQTWFGCFCEGQLAGYAGVQCAGGAGYIGNVAVDPDFRRMGAGKSLLAAIDALAAERSLEEVTLEVRQSNAAAIALYEGAGYCRVGLRNGYYDDPREAAVLMTKYYAGRDEK